MNDNKINIVSVKPYEFANSDEQLQAMKENRIILTREFYNNIFISYGLDPEDEFIKNNIISKPISKWYAMLTDLSVPENIRNGIKNLFIDLNKRMQKIKEENYEMYIFLFKRLGEDFGIEITDKIIENFEKNFTNGYNKNVTN